MPSIRLIATLAVPFLGAAVLAGLWTAWSAPATGLPGGAPAPVVTAAPATPASPVTSPSAAAGDAEPSIAAAAVLRRFCDLVDRDRWARACDLLAGPWVWPSGGLRALARLRFLSARLRPAGLTDDLVFATRCRVRLRAPGARHHIAKLVFTLGRGGTDGGWLITAVTPRP